MENCYYDSCDVIRETLKKKNITQKDFAKAFGKTLATVKSLFCNKTKVFDEDELDDISAYLGISKNVLMTKPVSTKMTPRSDMKYKYFLVKPLKKEENMNKYSYTVNGSGYVKANASSSTDELKAQLKKYASYCDEKDKEIAELKAQLESERAHGDFFEKRFREVENQNKLLEDELEKKTALVNELSSLNTSLKRQAESVDFSIARDLRDAVAERDKYKEMLLKILVDRYTNEVG